jgi:hypothetical protein
MKIVPFGVPDGLVVSTETVISAVPGQETVAVKQSSEFVKVQLPGLTFDTVPRERLEPAFIGVRGDELESAGSPPAHSTNVGDKMSKTATRANRLMTSLLQNLHYWFEELPITLE